MASKFQHRHYEWLAEFIGQQYKSLPNIDTNAVHVRRCDLAILTDRMVTALREDNPRFKAELFRKRIMEIREDRRTARYLPRDPSYEAN